MKLLFDENLSRRLVAKLEDLYPGSTHAVLAGLGQRPDREIWEFARRENMIVVSADADFYELATVLGPPPKFVWLQGCDYPTRVAENLLRGQAVRIARFFEEADRANSASAVRRSYASSAASTARTIASGPNS